MLLFDKKLDINKDLKKTIENVSKECITVRYGNVFIMLNNPKTLTEITKLNFSYNEEDNKYDLTLSKLKDLNKMGIVNNSYIYLDNIKDLKIDVDNIELDNKTKYYKLKLYDKVVENGSNIVYKMPIFIADVLTVLQDFSISKRW